DLESDAATLGKTAGKDAEQQKMTWPACVGIEASRGEAKALIEQARAFIEPIDANGDLGALADFIYDRLH
ncbi:MAG: polyprenyl synthetase family protein, partial [Planctomycetes bacterium]|nr:polyprenyl synthetase family protein [Planctomycetota bacterium]